MRHLEWLNLNSQRSYPIKEDLSKLDVTGNFRIPNELLVDAVIVVDLEVISKVYIKSLTILSEILSISFGDQNENLIGAVTASATPNASYLIQGNEDLIGKIVVGEIPDTIGAYEFKLEATELESRVIIPNIRGLKSLGIYGTNEPLEGHVKLKEGNNVRLTYERSLNAIKIDTKCQPLETVDCIKYINGIPSDSSNNFNIQGIGCIKVSPISNGIKIENTCEEPCCDCTSIDNLNITIDNLNEQIYSLDERITALEQQT